MIKITFLPDKKNIEVNKGTTALEALERTGINIDTPCGGKGICGKCKILIKKGFRLACQTKLFQCFENVLKMLT